MAKVTDVLDLALREMNTKEYPPNSNNVKYNTAFYGKEVHGASYPWCCTFVWWVLNKAGVECKKTASCMDLANWFKAKGRFHTKNPKQGDLVFFKFSTNDRWTNHVGIVESVNTNGSISTFEGNTSMKSDDNGGCVMARIRKLNGTIVGFATPDYEKEAKPVERNCYPACLPNFTSLVDALESIGADSSRGMRYKIAEANGITYHATAEDNIHMLKLLKNGALKKPY